MINAMLAPANPSAGAHAGQYTRADARAFGGGAGGVPVAGGVGGVPPTSGIVAGALAGVRGDRVSFADITVQFTW